MPRSAWLATLQGLGFQGACAVPDDRWTTRGAAQQALMLAQAPLGGQTWTLVGDVQGLGQALAERLRARGDQVQILAADAVPPAGALGEIIYLAGLELAERGLDDREAATLTHTLAGETPRRWLAAAAQGQGRIRFVTQGVQGGAGGAMSPGAAWQAPLWGWGRGFSLEQPGAWGGLIDLPSASTADTLLEALDAVDGEDQVAWRDGQRRVARLVQADTPPAAPLSFSADACYLVTGGFGGLGLVVARWLAEHGARHIALLGATPTLARPAWPRSRSWVLACTRCRPTWPTRPRWRAPSNSSNATRRRCAA